MTDPNTYTVRAECDNCGFVGDTTVVSTVRLSSSQCPTCRCLSTLRLASSTLRSTRAEVDMSRFYHPEPDYVQFQPQAVLRYLDGCIVHWRDSRKRAEEALDEEKYTIACCYVDAFQSVRGSLFGELLP